MATGHPGRVAKLLKLYRQHIKSHQLRGLHRMCRLRALSRGMPKTRVQLPASSLSLSSISSFSSFSSDSDSSDSDPSDWDILSVPSIPSTCSTDDSTDTESDTDSMPDLMAWDADNEDDDFSIDGDSDDEEEWDKWARLRAYVYANID
ncbi:hypothetical protein C8J56DRAFT_889714 [Mycena floridula]|nr:hypothetical protein C8J56DRAFT_889714 [Mycena floridula]